MEIPGGPPNPEAGGSKNPDSNTKTAMERFKQGEIVRDPDGEYRETTGLAVDPEFATDDNKVEKKHTEWDALNAVTKREWPKTE